MKEYKINVTEGEEETLTRLGVSGVGAERGKMLTNEQLLQWYISDYLEGKRKMLLDSDKAKLTPDEVEAVLTSRS